MNEYERKREERIARNKAILAELLAVSDGARECLDATTRAQETKSSAKRERKESRENVEVRRSNRVRGFAAPVYTTFDVDDDLGDAPRGGKRARATGDETERRARSTAASARKPSAPPSANSLRALRAKLWDVYAEYLGERIEPPDGDGGMKAAVVRVLSPVSNPKFSKMSGIQEWKNCVVLYVNVGDKHGNSYDNVFTRAGSRISWFAQPRQDEESPAIRTILKTATLDEESVEDAVRRAEDGEQVAPKYADWPLHLFCRMEGDAYVYCGRLKMVEHDPNRTPMKFQMRLLDAPLLRTSSEFLGLVELGEKR